MGKFDNNSKMGKTFKGIRKAFGREDEPEEELSVPKEETENKYDNLALDQKMTQERENRKKEITSSEQEPETYSAIESPKKQKFQMLKKRLGRGY